MSSPGAAPGAHRPQQGRTIGPVVVRMARQGRPPITATCPAHGVVHFGLNAICNWWECPEVDVCDSVIPLEDVTPDGADVTTRDEVTSRGVA